MTVIALEYVLEQAVAEATIKIKQLVVLTFLTTLILILSIFLHNDLDPAYMKVFKRNLLTVT